MLLPQASVDLKGTIEEEPHAMPLLSQATDRPRRPSHTQTCQEAFAEEDVP